MPSTHRGTPVGDNHRPTPRLARALANHLNWMSHESHKNFVWDNPTWGMSNPRTTPEQITANQAQDALNLYRKRRDASIAYEKNNPEIPYLGQPDVESDIAAAYSNRSFGKYDPSV